MRMQINKNNLSKKQQEILKKIGLPKDNKDTYFYEWLKLAKDYKKENKHLNAPKDQLISEIENNINICELTTKH